LLSRGPLGVRTAVGRVAFFTCGYKIPEYASQVFPLTAREKNAMSLFLNDYKIMHLQLQDPKDSLGNPRILSAQESLPDHA
jgi:hypothetical protein